MTERETMVMPDLPTELEEEILSWVPAASLKRLLSSCKRWKALLKDQRFTEKHLRRAPKQPLTLMLKKYRLCPMSVDLNVVPPTIEFKDALRLKDSHSKNSKQVRIAEVYHCDGWLLCITKDNRPVVWNPCLGEPKWIQHKNEYNKLCRFALGYESNQSCRIYKILMSFRGKQNVYEIYSFSSNSWRVVNAPNHCFRPLYVGVCLRGSTYWITLDDDTGNFHLLRFDFTRERFRLLCLPQSLDRSRGYMALSVVREKHLSVISFNTSGSREFEMWVTNKIDTEGEFSWSKSFAMGSNRIRANSLYVYTSLLIDEEKKVALCCDIQYYELASSNKNVVYTIGEDDDEYYTEIPYVKKSRVWSRYMDDERMWRPFIFSYVPSLVQIQPK